MRDVRRLAALRKLLAVQRAQRSAAETAMHEAREQELSAREGEDRARLEMEAAQADWLDWTGRPGFSPDYQRALAARLLGREQERESRALEAVQAEAATGQRQQAWQTLEAQVSGGERGARGLARRVARRREERLTAEQADRVTSNWSRR